MPDDALDFALDAVYVHSRDTLVPKMYVPMQPETLGKETWRVLRNEIKVRRSARAGDVIALETSGLMKARSI